MDRPLVDPGAVYKFLFFCLSRHVVDRRLFFVQVVVYEDLFEALVLGVFQFFSTSK